MVRSKSYSKINLALKFPRPQSNKKYMGDPSRYAFGKKRMIFWIEMTLATCVKRLVFRGDRLTNTTILPKYGKEKLYGK